MSMQGRKVKARVRKKRLLGERADRWDGLAHLFIQQQWDDRLLLLQTTAMGFPWLSQVSS